VTELAYGEAYSLLVAIVQSLSWTRFLPRSWPRSRGWEVHLVPQRPWAIESNGTLRSPGNSLDARTAHCALRDRDLPSHRSGAGDPDEDEIVLIVPKVVCQRIPSPMYDAFIPFPFARGSLLEVRLPLADRTQLIVILGDGGRV